MVPLANMFGYVNTLRSMSFRDALHNTPCRFERYDAEVPKRHVAEEVVAKLRLIEFRANQIEGKRSLGSPAWT